LYVVYSEQMKKIISIITLLMTLVVGCKSQYLGTKSKAASKLFGQAMLDYQIMEFEKAIASLDKAIKKDGKYADAYDLRGQCHRALGNNKEAESDWRKAIGLTPDGRYNTTIDLCELLMDQQRYDEAKKLLDIIIRATRKGALHDKAKRMYRSADYAAYAVANPVPFEPVNMGPEINTDHEEYFPCLSLDEGTFYFTRRNGKLAIYAQNEDLFSSVKQSDSWTTAVNLGKPINTDENEAAFNLSPDGKYLLFTSCSRKGGMGTCDIWVTRNKGGQWQEPSNLGPPVNTKFWETQPSLSPDGQTLYFTSNRPGGYGGSDIWYSQLKDGRWQKPINMGPEINTVLDEQFPFIHHDGKTLYFSSAGLPGMGKSDIFITRKTTEGWSKPRNLGYPINSKADDWNFTVNRTGETAYISSDREEGFGGLDIYSFPLYEEIRPNQTSYVKGIVFDVDTKKPVAADVKLVRHKDSELASFTRSDEEKGNFIIPLPAGESYAFEAVADGYLFYSDKFTLEQNDLSKPYELNIGLKKITSNQSVVLENIFFDVNQSTLKSESKAGLNMLLTFLLKNPSLKVEIGGHTDSDGSVELNQKLSKDRAETVYNWLIQKGIDASRLTFKGYGPNKPLVPNDTPENKAKNRRTEFTILNS
jgi:outer membrane protein OmpA-like peptidoglycan-associated protein